jgi:hypothetical protein
VTKHTPGPWEPRTSAEFTIWRRWRDQQGRTCHSPVGQALDLAGITSEERAANASLIAASPDLLTSLRKTLAAAVELHAQGIGCPDCPPDAEDTGEDCPMLVAAEAAIAKAEGK